MTFLGDRLSFVRIVGELNALCTLTVNIQALNVKVSEG